VYFEQRISVQWYGVILVELCKRVTVESPFTAARLGDVKVVDLACGGCHLERRGRKWSPFCNLHDHLKQPPSSSSMIERSYSDRLYQIGRFVMGKGVRVDV